MTTFSGRLTADMVEAYSKSGYWHADTFHDVLARHTDQHPDHEVLYDGRFRVTYRELADRVDAVAAMLQAHGIGRHDIVTIQLPNWIEFACAFFAVERLGAIAIQVSTDFRERELEFILEFSSSAAFICAWELRGFDHLSMTRTVSTRSPRSTS